jgi:hypothetical protein
MADRQAHVLGRVSCFADATSILMRVTGSGAPEATARIPRPDAFLPNANEFRLQPFVERFWDRERTPVQHSTKNAHIRTLKFLHGFAGGFAAGFENSLLRVLARVEVLLASRDRASDAALAKEIFSRSKADKPGSERKLVRSKYAATCCRTSTSIIFCPR